MKIEIDVTKQHIASLVFAIAIVLGISYAVAQLPNPGHGADRVGPGIFAGGGDYIFPAGSVLQAADSAYFATSSGRVGIGTVGPLGRLDVSGDFVVKDDGKVGIGTTDPSTELDVAGEINATGDICTELGRLNCLGDAYPYGGSYTLCYGGTCDIPNYYTGDCTCPAGYIERYMGRGYYPTSGVCSDWQYFYECVK